MKCNVCGSKKTELLTSWACDTCDFGSKTPVADHILGFDKGTDVQRLRQQEVFRGGPDRSLWDDLNKEYSGAEGLANDKPLYTPGQSLFAVNADEDISEAESNAMARYAFGLGEPAPVEAVRDFFGKRYEPEEAARLRAKYPRYLDEPAPARHWDILPSKIPAWYRRGLEWAKQNDMLPGTCAEVAPANQLPDDVAELVDAASLLWDTAGEACEFIDDLAMKHQLLDDVHALRLTLDRILYKEQTK